ncbi:MAG: hypothetical protein Q7R49_01870 [Candidatus Daviesbacteria bacterium]|nr:hypothetical protein [Candidatus Daviesbacteria bacterium]
MLDTLDQGINIRDLNIEEPGAPWPPFDADRDVTDTDWNKVFAELGDNLGKKGLKDWIIMDSAYLKLLSPKRYHTIVTPEQAEESLSSDLVRNDEFYRNRSTVKLLYPQTKGSILYPDVLLAGEAKNKSDPGIISRLLDITRKNNDNKDNWENFLRLAFSGRILFPNDDLGITREDWEQTRDSIYNRILNNNDLLIPGYLFEAKIVFPKESRELDEKISLDKLKQRAYASLANGWTSTFVGCVLDLKALFSEEIIVTNEGIEFIPKPNPAELTYETPALPEVRKF